MPRLIVIATLFFLSGGTALLYQVAFGKRLATVFGATAYAVSAVLAAFMGGLALGSWLGGRVGGRLRRPLVAYGVAEVAVGAVCALTPWLFHTLTDLYVRAVQAAPASLPLVSAVRMALTAMVVLVPTVAMGLTLPLLARVVSAPGAGAEDGPPRRLGLLYAVNTAGGATGALASAYLVLPGLGTDRTMWSAAVVNVAIGAIAIALGRRAPSSARAAQQEVPHAERLTAAAAGSASPAGDTTTSSSSDSRAGSRHEWRLLGVLAAASGLLVFAAEVVDTHLLALLIGNSAYAFGLMLAVFLSCLSVGATLAGVLERRAGAMALPLSLACSALALLCTIPLWDQVPRIFLWAGPYVSSWAGREWVRAAAALVVLLVPTVTMGLTFPLLLRRVAARANVAGLVGRLTAINTVGAIVGSLVTGYFVLPTLGSEWSLRAVALIFAACAILAAVWPLLTSDRLGQGKAERDQDSEAGRNRLRRARLAFGRNVGLTAVALVVLLPRWDLRGMTNGANVYFDVQPAADALVFVREDVHGGFTSVALRGTTHTLYTNGKFQGDDGGELTAQRSFAHFPAIFVREFGRAMVIGLGTGCTLATLAAYPFERLDIAETSPAIVEAARDFFGRVNQGRLDDPRVHVELNDGRNVLLLASEPYDLITIELSSVWFAGAANLYSREFYQLCRDRLTRSGILQQWVQLHHIRRQELAVVLRTIRDVFPHVALFVAGRQGITVASAEPLVASRSRLAGLEDAPTIRAMLDSHSVDETHGPLGGLLRYLVLSGEELDRFVSDTEGEPIVSTDDNLYLEHATPRGNVMRYETSLSRTVELLERYAVAEPFARHLGP